MFCFLTPALQLRFSISQSYLPKEHQRNGFNLGLYDVGSFGEVDGLLVSTLGGLGALVLKTKILSISVLH